MAALAKGIGTLRSTGVISPPPQSRIYAPCAPPENKGSPGLAEPFCLFASGALPLAVIGTLTPVDEPRKLQFRNSTRPVNSADAASGKRCDVPSDARQERGGSVVEPTAVVWQRPVVADKRRDLGDNAVDRASGQGGESGADCVGAVLLGSSPTSGRCPRSRQGLRRRRRQAPRHVRWLVR